MKPITLPSHLLAISLLASLAPAQTALWLGQSPSDPNRLSAWTDGANWSTGTVPNGSSAVAHIDQDHTAAGGLVALDRVQILNADVTLDTLEFGLYSPDGYYYDPALGTPNLLIGGAGTTDRGSLELTGSGFTDQRIRTGSYYLKPALRLENGALRFRNHAAVASPTSVNAQAGSNQIWFGDDSQATGLTVTMGPATRLEFADRARLTNSVVLFNGGHLGFSGSSALSNGSISVNAPGLVLFADEATAHSPYISFNRPTGSTDAIVNFSGHAYVEGGTVISYNSAGIVEFTDQADANSFNVTVRQLDITGASTGTGTTGRHRATVNTPTATSVVADDARTVILGVVSVEDLLLGSNTVLVRGGSLRYISDVGGAYLSAGGANLSGGGLIMAGSYSNSLYLAPTNAPSPYAVPLTIEYGTVHTDRQKVGAVTVGPAGSLNLRSGTSASLLNHGVVSLAATDYLVTGDYTQTPTGTLAVTMPYSGSNVPRLDVAGRAQLAGTLTVYYGNAYFVGSRRHAILRAGSIAGSFTSATSHRVSPMLSVGVEYAGNEVLFAYTQRPFVNAGATASQQALGAHLDATLGNATGEFYNLVLRLNTLQDPALIAAGLGQLAPDRYGVLNEQGFAAAAARQSALDRQLARLRDGPRTDGFAVLLEAGQQQHESSSLDGLPAVTFRNSGGLAGVSWRQGRWSAGVTAARDRSRAELDGIGSHARISSHTPGVFAQYDAGRFFLNAAASRSRDDYTLVRNSGIISRPSVVSARPSGRRTDLSFTAGTTLSRASWTLTPHAGVLASHVEVDDFTESRVSGAPASELAFTRWSVGSLRTRAGFDLARTTGRVTPRFSLVWLHELEQDRGLSAGLAAAGGARYRAPGRPAETDLVQASFGVDWRLTRRLGFSVNAGLAHGRNSATTSDLSAGFRWEF